MRMLDCYYHFCIFCFDPCTPYLAVATPPTPPPSIPHNDVIPHPVPQFMLQKHKTVRQTPHAQQQRRQKQDQIDTPQRSWVLGGVQHGSPLVQDDRHYPSNPCQCKPHRHVQTPRPVLVQDMFTDERDIAQFRKKQMKHHQLHVFATARRDGKTTQGNTAKGTTTNKNAIIQQHNRQPTENPNQYSWRIPLPMMDHITDFTQDKGRVD